ncbi:MAG: DUF5605 domain-containing protein [Acidobacteria bacterium]|nr:DUF5605 domain-containing protein [Acidobacteriota bacterium]
MKLIVVLALLATAVLAQPPQSAEQWGVFELSLRGPAGGNPFLEVQFGAEFQFQNRVVKAQGFYDGNGVYRVRFMPDAVGVWTWTTRGNRPELDGKKGQFTCTAPSKGNHGPVTVRNTRHFGYADGTPYFPVGTTCYAWAHQGDALEEQTLATLRTAPFNKMRMCVFPKDYAFNKNEPRYYPFPSDPAGRNDFTRFDPAFFRHFEKRVKDLLDLGIEADLILFHPYDRWGYKNMPAEADDRYLRYTVARLAAFRNVWWSMANEFDFMKEKKLSDWDRFFRIVQESDPYRRLRSIHNGAVLYDHAKPWVTHASIQSDEFTKTAGWLEAYSKPVIFDECKYEGNIPQRWGNISAKEMVRRFWLGTALGAYVGHGETYLHPQDILWWSKGGALHGESAPRIAFLRKILEEGPPQGLDAMPGKYPMAGVPGVYYLCFFDVHQPGEWEFDLPAGVRYQVEILDPWEMTIAPVSGTFEGKFKVKLPSRPYLVVRVRKLDSKS